MKKQTVLLEQFYSMYNQMYSEKGMSGIYVNHKEIEAYIEYGSLFLTCAYVDEKPVVFHSYIGNDNRVRLLHSCSEFRNLDNARRNAIGRANKYLHWEDMLYFKSLGTRAYDWGGVTSFENLNGIDKFKMAFGGTPHSYYNLSAEVSFKAKLFNYIYNMRKN